MYSIDIQCFTISIYIPATRPGSPPPHIRVWAAIEILYGPSHLADGKTNFIGALRRAMASTGYVDVKNFQARPPRRRA